MKKYINIFLSICLLFAFNLLSLNRDSDLKSSYNGCYYCTDAIPEKYEFDWLTPDLIRHIPDWKDHNCTTCNGSPIYGYYFESIYTENFKNQLLHCDHVYNKYNKTCKCFWPELSEQAAEISNLAYNLFSDILSAHHANEYLPEEEGDKHLV